MESDGQKSLTVILFSLAIDLHSLQYSFVLSQILSASSHFLEGVLFSLPTASGTLSIVFNFIFVNNLLIFIRVFVSDLLIFIREYKLEVLYKITST